MNRNTPIGRHAHPVAQTGGPDATSQPGADIFRMAGADAAAPTPASGSGIGRSGGNAATRRDGAVAGSRRSRVASFPGPAAPDPDIAADSAKRSAGHASDSLDWHAAGRAAVKDLKSRIAGRRSRGLLGILGHGDACIARAKSGRPLSCSCRTRGMNDPAVAVALAMHFARQATLLGIPVPSGIIRLLGEHIEKGDPACLAVADWLERQGLLDETETECGSAR